MHLQLLNAVPELVAWAHLEAKSGGTTRPSKASVAPAYTQLVTFMWSCQVWGREGREIRCVGTVVFACVFKHEGCVLRLPAGVDTLIRHHDVGMCSFFGRAKLGLWIFEHSSHQLF
eukprot:1157971-Pelagomonas_calceolata.AAC.5